MKHQFEAEVQKCIERLHSTTSKQRQQAAAELVRLGIRIRGAIVPRGTVVLPAKSRFPEPSMQRELQVHLSDVDPAVRQEVALAMGEWGDEQAAQALTSLLLKSRDQNEDVRMACVVALKMIGGSTAVATLAQTATQDPSTDVCFAALAALEELGAGGWTDVTDRPPWTSRATSDGSKLSNTTLDEPIMALARLRDNETVPKYVRQKAMDVLTYIQVDPKRELQNICDPLNYAEPDTQQVLVNAKTAVFVSILLHKAALKRGLRMVRPVRIRDSFPIRSDINDTGREGRKVTVDDLCKISIKYQEETKRPISEAFEVISEHIADLEKRRLTIESSRDLVLLEEITPKRISIVSPMKKINEKRRVLNELELRHEAQLAKVFGNEGIGVYSLPQLPFLSVLVEYETEDGQVHYAVIIKKGLHQALKEFLLAHELGHFFLHVKNNLAKKSDFVDRYLRSSAEHTFLEEQADNFGIAILFPPAYLSDRAILKEELSAKALFKEFVSDMKPVSPTLKREMLRYIGEHIKRYEEFKEEKMRGFLTIEVKSIDEKNIEALLNIIHETNKSACWVRLDRDSTIVRASDGFAELFGLSKKEMIGMTPIDLVVPEEVERMQQRSAYRINKKRAICYFTEIQNNRRTGNRQVIVYSFPILRDNDYVGAMGILLPIDQLGTEATPPGGKTIH